MCNSGPCPSGSYSQFTSLSTIGVLLEAFATLKDSNGTVILKLVVQGFWKWVVLLVGTSHTPTVLYIPKVLADS